MTVLYENRKGANMQQRFKLVDLKGKDKAPCVTVVIVSVNVNFKLLSIQANIVREECIKIYKKTKNQSCT